MYPLLVTTRRCRDGVSMVSFRVEAGSGDSGHIRVLNAKRDLNADDHLRGASHIQHGGGEPWNHSSMSPRRPSRPYWPYASSSQRDMRTTGNTARH
jgi:hypothetical protein